MKGKKQSIFIGRKVPLLENGVPILYQRYTKLSELGISSEEDEQVNEGSETANGDLNQQINQQYQIQKEQQQIDPISSVTKRKIQTQDEDNSKMENDQKNIKKKKLINKKVQQEVVQQEGDEPTSLQNDNETSTKMNKNTLKKLKKLLKQKEKEKVKNSTEDQDQGEQINLSDDLQEESAKKTKEDLKNKGNLEEAMEMRKRLSLKPGINKSARTVKPFTFDFQQQLPSQGEQQGGEKQKQNEETPQQQLKGQKDDENSQYIPRRVYIGGMPYSWSEQDVREYWEYCGDIEDISMTQFEDSGRFKGIAFITFQTQEGYEAALQYNGTQCEAGTLKIKPCEKNSQKRGTQQINNNKNNSKNNGRSTISKYTPQKVQGYNVAYVGNLAYDLSKEQIMEFFSSCLPKSVKLHTDKYTGEPRGFAHVFFENEEQLDNAIQQNGMQLGGREIIVRYGQPKKNQQE